MAKEKGFYKEAGLDVEIKKFTINTNTIDEVVNYRATYGIGRSNLIWKYSEGEPISLISATFQSSPYVFLALESSNIKRLEDFAGKTIMLAKDSMQTASIHAMLHSEDTNEKSVIVKDHTFDIEELIDGRVDIYHGYVSSEPYMLQKRGIPFKAFSPKDKGFDFYSDILFTSQKEAENNPKRVLKFKLASLKGWKYAFDNINETVDFIYSKYNSQNKTRDALMFEALELKKLAYINNIKLGDIDKNKISRILDVYKVLGFSEGNDFIEEMLFTDGNVLLSKEEQRYLNEKKDIRICVAPSSLPYSAIEKDEFIGIGASVLKMSQKMTNVKHTLVKTKSWKESLIKAENRECDLIPIIGEAHERYKYLDFTTAYYEEPLVMVTKKSKNYILDIHSVEDKLFSILKGRPYIDLLRKQYPNIKLKIVDSIEEGYYGVDRGDYYGHIDITLRAAYILQKMPYLDLKILRQFEDTIKIGFAIRNDDKMLFSIYDKVSRNIKKSELQKSISSWIKVNYTQKVEFKYLKEAIGFIILLFAIFYSRHYTLNKKNTELKELQDELLELNKSLESKVDNAVKEIQKKDTYMLHQSRLAQMGEMMSMIAHQWKQPLASISALNISIKMAIELEKYDLEDEKQRDDFIEFLKEKTKKIGAHNKNLGDIISDFSEFYKPNSNAKLMHMDNSINKAYGFIRESLESMAIDVKVDLDSSKEVSLHENQFIQVILNILSNAAEQLAQRKCENPTIWIKSYDENDKVVVEISDNAGGISKDIIDKIFDPYFSTKLEKNGTGLGLHMSKNIIEQHCGGTIYAKNNEAGAVFVIEIDAE